MIIAPRWGHPETPTFVEFSMRDLDIHGPESWQTWGSNIKIWGTTDFCLSQYSLILLILTIQWLGYPLLTHIPFITASCSFDQLSDHYDHCSLMAAQVLGEKLDKELYQQTAPLVIRTVFQDVKSQIYPVVKKELWVSILPIQWGAGATTWISQ